jgi:predicted RNA methylase
MPTLGEVDAVVTDPPFGMCFVSSFRRDDTKHRPIENDDKTDFLEWACEIKVKHSKYIFCRWDNLYDVPKPQSLITWVKNNHSMGDLKHEHGRKTEVCLFYPSEDHFFPSGRPNDVINADRTGNNYHPTEKPISLMKKVASWTDGVVVDPFMGSGTTGVACLQMGRKFIGIEKDPEYFEIACQRIQQEHNQLKMF